MDIYELIIDESNEEAGIQAISIVENPAMESEFIVLSENQKVELTKSNEDEMILTGAALIPNKPVFRANDGEGFYIFFSEATVKLASQLFFKNNNHKEATIEHNKSVEGMTIVESWIKESEADKSVALGLDVPVGTWLVSMKVDDKEIWDNEIKGNKVFGFSIEGMFADRLAKKDVLSTDLSNQDLENRLKEVIKVINNFYNN